VHSRVTYNRADPSAFDVLAVDDGLPADPVVLDYWISNLRHSTRLTLLHACRLPATLILCLVYFVKRLIPFQFTAHRFLQATICWFMDWWVTPEANALILRHFWVESNVINFIIANSREKNTERAALYPRTISELKTMTFLQHDIVLLNALYDLGPTLDEQWPVPRDELDFSTMREIVLDYDATKRRWCQVLDFETAHELFKTLFCVLVSAEEYERSINSLNLDQTLGLRVSRILEDPWVATMAVNVMPLYFIGPLNISRRFVMHGLFTEHLHEYLQRARRSAAAGRTLTEA
jgi:hypothetical protein